tara:strand:+ start:44 stop:898 length:855 start_codon:yes stop_codon:yes gene_type:complete
LPELPEVETVRRGLDKSLKGFCIEKVEVLSERSIASNGGYKEFVNKLKGLVIGPWERRGKYLIASLHKNKSGNPSGWLVVHLRMTGHFQWIKEGKSPCSHTRVRFLDKRGYEIRFVDMRNFGQLWWLPVDRNPKEAIKGIKNLGPEPFSKEFSPAYLQKSLKNKKRSIKSALLDQSIFAGTGNIYADESLFYAEINPLKKSGDLTKIELEKLCFSLIKVLKKSIGEGGTTFKDFRDIEGINGNYGGQAWVYRRSKEPCKKCGTIIKKEKIAGRSSHWCPKCQKE